MRWSRGSLRSTEYTSRPLFGQLTSCTHALLLMLNAFNYSSILWRIEGYVRGILFWKQFAVLSYTSTRTTDEAQNVAIYL